MSKCGNCGRFLSSADGAKCNKCNAFFHRRCVALPPVGTTPVTWQCPECRKKRNTNADTPVPQGTASEQHDTVINTSDSCHSSPETTQELANDIAVEMRLFRDNLRSINKDLQLFREDMADIRETVKLCQCKINQLEVRVATIENQPKGENEVAGIIEQLKQDLNARDQELLANDVEVVNLAESQGENPIHLTLQIAKKLGTNIDERDIISAERVGGRRIVATAAAGPETRPRPLVVRLARRSLRDELLINARSRRGATSADIGVAGPPKRFYVNERLTKVNRSLFRQARDAAQQQGWMYVWCKRGRILARCKAGDQAFAISNETDIVRVFGANITPTHVNK